MPPNKYICKRKTVGLVEGAGSSLIFLQSHRDTFKTQRNRHKQMIDKTALEKVVNEAIEGSDIFLVDIEISPDNRIVVEIDSMTNVGIDDCVKINNAIEANFDRDKEDYELEVGSAGLTAPFKIKAQYLKNVGNPVEVLTTDGRKLKGTLKEAGDDSFTITTTSKVKPEGAKRPVMMEEDITINYNETKYTKNIID